MSSRPTTGSIEVRRDLPIDAGLLEDVFVNLRRECGGVALRWSLGDRGIAEVDSQFAPVLYAHDDHPAWSTSARLWDSGGLVVAGAVVSITTTTPDDVTLAVQPSTTLPAWWETRLSSFLDLVHAVVDEIAEELLWHATRDRIGTS